MKAKECLPIGSVLDTVIQVEKDVAGFYNSAHEIANDAEVKEAFGRLVKEKEQSIATLGPVCDSISCGLKELEGATQEDIHFLSALAESGFYRKTGKPVELADPALQLKHLLDNALKLEKDLLLFYMKFFGVSCADHRPMFSELLQRGQRHVSELRNIKSRLEKGL